MKTKATKQPKLTRIEAKIKRLNEAYQKATPVQRRKMIARDCLEQIAAERFVPTSGLWADVRVDGVEPNADRALQPLLHQPDIDCQCCGVGAVFMSYVRLNNKATYSDSDYYSRIEEKIQWPQANLRLIELAFEQGCGQHSTDYSDEDDAAVDFGCKYGKHSIRLKAILNNIITSEDGLFHP